MNLDFWAPTLIGLILNALVLAWVLGKLFATVQGNGQWLQAVSDRVKIQEDKNHQLHVALTTVAATCAAYFSQNPSPVAAEALHDVLKDLEKL